MAKVTSKFQVTIPKALAERLQIRPGDDVDWLAVDDSLRIVPRRRGPTEYTIAERLKIFDQATRRQRERERSQPARARARERGWTREELYERGRPR